MTASPTLAWILFDVGETLLHPAPDFPRAFADVCRRRGVAVAPTVVEEAAAATWRERPGAHGHGYSLSPGASRAFWTGLYTALLERLGETPARIPALADALYAHFSSPASYELFPDVLPSLQACRAAGLRLGVVSNFEAWLPDCLAGLGILEFFDVVAVSGIEGFEKPDRRLFEVALERAGAPAGEVLYVGDSVTSDYEPARALGMQAVLLDRDGAHAGFAGSRVASLDELCTMCL